MAYTARAHREHDALVADLHDVAADAVGVDVQVELPSLLMSDGAAVGGWSNTVGIGGFAPQGTDSQAAALP